MKTIIVSIDPKEPADEALHRAAKVIQDGGLVAFPTETVYGLGASALNKAAVAGIFAAKGRPPQNPLIVHVANAAAARALVRSWPAKAAALARRFWPGPLTLVLKKRRRVPGIVTASGPTVAVRVPAHPVALGLLRACGVPLAAPSANRSSRISPTSAAHVIKGLKNRIHMILDAGPTPGGLESTVLDLTTTPPRLLRPGLIAPNQIESIIGPISLAPDQPPRRGKRALRSPGLLGRHYAPQAPVECVEGTGRERVEELCRQDLHIGWIKRGRSSFSSDQVVVRTLRADPIGYARGLYAALHDLDAAGVQRIVVALPPSGDEWLAIQDRLRRAAQKCSQRSTSV